MRGLNEGLNEGLSEGLKSLLDVIIGNLGVQAKNLISLLGNGPIKTIDASNKTITLH